MKIAIEVKIGLAILYTIINGVLLNGCIWCLNQPSNIYLTAGVLCGMVIVLFNMYVGRKFICCKLIEEEPKP
jgi:hypothetical protein